MKQLNIGFDLDGTLLDSLYRHKIVLLDSLIQFGYKVSIENLDDYYDYKRNTSNTDSYMAFKGYKDVLELSLYWKKIIELEKYLELDVYFPNVERLLTKLSSDHKIYVVTARRIPVNTIAALKKIGLIYLIKRLVIVHPENNPSLAKYNETKELNLDFVVGDTEVDEGWADSLGAKFLPVNYGYRSNEWWKLKGYDSFSDFESVYNEIIKDT